MGELERLASSCVLPGFEGPTVPDWIRRRIDEGLGGVVLYAWNVESREQLRALTDDLRSERGDFVIAIDEEGGSVVREVQRTCELLGTNTTVQEDVGVAGLHRLAVALPDLRAADCVVVAAGQDAALASVVGGLVATPVIAVPTSVGYGVAAGGQVALMSMLSSCAPGVAVVDIDDGFGAATVASRIARAAAA